MSVVYVTGMYEIGISRGQFCFYDFKILKNVSMK